MRDPLLRTLVLGALLCAPTPCQPRPQMPWQRNLTDALALVEASGKPLLICVNIDGEVACESLARRRYRDPAFIELADGFVCLLVSPDRHGDLDYDDRGRRVPDTKFGRVTSYEHIAIEQDLYERYFDGRRVAPRHIGVSPDGKVLFDIFLTRGLEPVDDALREHGVPGSTRREDLWESPDAADRDQLEQRFLDADENGRAGFASRALGTAKVRHPEILRMALRDASPAVRHTAAETAAQHFDQLPQPLWGDALRAAHGDPALLDSLLSHLESLAATGEEGTREQASDLTKVFRGLRSNSPVVDLARWEAAIAGDDTPAESPLTEEEIPDLDDRLNQLEARLREAPGQSEVHLAIAEATMRYARIRIAFGADPRFLLHDARAAAENAAQSDSTRGLARAYTAWAAHLLGEDDAGDLASRALPDLADHASSPAAAACLDAFARARTAALYEKMTAGEPWSAEDIAAVATAYRALLAHPAATAGQAGAFADFLDVMWAWGPAQATLEQALARFEGDGSLHEKLRATAIRAGGGRELLAAYCRIAGADASPTMTWFAGLAALTAAARLKAQGDDHAANAYGEAVAHFERAMAAAPEFEATSRHYISASFTGRAQLRLDAERLADAADDVLQALEVAPASAESELGDGATPLSVAKTILRRLRAAKDPKADTLKSALDAMGPGR